MPRNLPRGRAQRQTRARRTRCLVLLMTVERAVTPRQEVSRDEQDATDQLVEELNENPATATSTAPVLMRNAAAASAPAPLTWTRPRRARRAPPGPEPCRLRRRFRAHRRTWQPPCRRPANARAVRLQPVRRTLRTRRARVNSAAGTKAQGPIAEGTQLTGLTKWLVTTLLTCCSAAGWPGGFGCGPRCCAFQEVSS